MSVACVAWVIANGYPLDVRHGRLMDRVVVEDGDGEVWLSEALGSSGLRYRLRQQWARSRS
jgi:hypothetical protein